jgi:hypothetical protein
MPYPSQPYRLYIFVEDMTKDMILIYHETTRVGETFTTLELYLHPTPPTPTTHMISCRDVYKHRKNFIL